MRTAERIAASIVRRWTGEQPESATEIRGRGKVNAVVRVVTPRSDVIVRMRDEVAAAAEYRKERWCLERAAEAGIPGPDVLDIGMYDATAFMIESPIEGVPGDLAPMPPADLWKRIGQFAKATHAIPVAGFGIEFGDAERRTFDDPHAASWRRFVRYNIDSLSAADDLIRLGVYAPHRGAELQDLFEWLGAQPLRFGLCHGDLNVRNTIITPTGDVALLDWGSARVSVVPYYDLSVVTRDGGDVASFLDGYGMTDDQFAAIRPGLLAFATLSAFDLVRWAIDREPSRTAHYARRAKSALRELDSHRGR